MKANQKHYFSNLFDKVLYMFQTSPLSIRSIATQYTCTNYKGAKNNTNFGQITGIQEKLDTTCK